MYGNMIHKTILYSLWIHTVITPWVKANNNYGTCTPWREWMNHQSAWIYKISVYLQTYSIFCMRINKHDRFILFFLNTCSELTSKRHVCVHGGHVWCNHLFTYSRYRFSSCQSEQRKNIPRCGLGLLRICSRNSRQEEVALTNALIWKRAASNPPPPPPTPPPRLAGDSAVALVSIRIHWLSPTLFLLVSSFLLSPLFPSLCHTAWFPSLSHPAISRTFSHYLILFNCPPPPNWDWDSLPSLVILFLSITLSNF